MRDFWWFARRLLRRKREMMLLLLAATISAGGLGAGLLSLGPMLRIILEQGGSLRTLAEQWNARHTWLEVPAWGIAMLPESAYAGVVMIMVGLVVLTLIGASANFIHQLLSMGVSSRAAALIRLEVFQHALHLPLAAVTRQGPTEFASRVLRDTGELRSGLETLTSKTLAQVTKGAAAFAAALLFDWRLVLVALVAGPVLAVALRKTGKSIRRGSRGALEASEVLMRTTNESLQGLRSVKTATAEHEALRRFNRANHEALRHEMRARVARALSGPIVETLAVFAVVALALVAARQILAGELPFDHFLLSLGSLAVAAGCMRPMAGFVNEMQAAQVPARRLRELLSMGREDSSDRGKPALRRHGRTIAFEAVSFRYPGSERLAVDQATLRVNHGERVAVVGPNGCGKTTLLSLLTRLFEPEAGRVTIDGVDIASIDVRTLRRQIGVVTQEAMLIKGTIEENVRFGLRGVDHGQVEAALRRAHAWDFVQRMPGGLQAAVGEQGASLSGGQRQRLAIARAVLRDPAILIMDEATSQIDAESEEQINQAIAEFGSGRSVLVIAHRLSTVLACDRIAVMDGGRVIDSGRHDELLGRCEVYQRLAQAQLTGVT
jgi:ABC-type multidrug transport system fused ATPase/permease subunit